MADEMVSSEYLSQDIFDADFLRVFSSFRALQMPLGTCRVDARHQFVTAPTRYQKAYTFIISIPVFIFHYLSIKYAIEKFYKYGVIYYLVVVVHILHACIYLINTVGVRFSDHDTNLLLYTRMQRIDRIMKFPKKFDEVVYMYNNLTVASIIGISVMLMILSSIVGLYMIITYGSMFCILCAFVVEICHCANQLIYFCLRTKYINAILSNYVKPKVYKSRSIVHIQEYMRNLAASAHHFETTDTEEYFKELLECFKVFQKLYELQILLFCVYFFIYTISTAEFVIQCRKHNITINAEWAHTAGILIMCIFVLLFLCLRSELFYREVREVKRLCIVILSTHYEGPLRKKAMAMLRLATDGAPTFSVYDAWRMDARLALLIANALTTFFITLLQLAYL